MPRPRFEKLPVEKRRHIIEAAGRELAARGYKGASLNRILEEAGVSKGAAYYYFDDKDDLIATVFRELAERILRDMDIDIEALAAETFWPTLSDAVDRFVASAGAEPWIVPAAKAMWALPPGSRHDGEIARAFEAVTAWMARLLRRGREVGVVRDDLPDGLLLAMMMAMDEAADRWILEHWDELGEARVAELTGAVFRMWRRLLEPQEV